MCGIAARHRDGQRGRRDRRPFRQRRVGIELQQPAADVAGITAGASLDDGLVAEIRRRIRPSRKVVAELSVSVIVDWAAAVAAPVASAQRVNATVLNRQTVW